MKANKDEEKLYGDPYYLLMKKEKKEGEHGIKEESF